MREKIGNTSQIAATEEMLKDPDMRELAEDEMTDLVARREALVAEIKVLLARLRDEPKDQPAWRANMEQLRALVTEHAAEEEKITFPKLRDRLSPEQNSRMTKLVNAQELRLA